MTDFRTFCRFLALPMAAVMLCASMPGGPARAALVPTERVLGATAPESARERVARFLAREDVRRQLQELGVDPDEAAARVAGLSDAEIDRIAGQIDRLPAGQGFFTSLLVVVLVAFLVLLVTDILGYTDIFPFVKKTARP